jgi:heme exporter protein A
LACRRGQRLLFDGLELRLQPGQVMWLRGSNGRGKTSLLRLLAGLSRPEAGQIRWGDEALPPQQMTYVGHHNALKEDLTALESLGFLARLHGQASSREALVAALQRLGLHSRRDAPVRTLSQGQRRRVALARLALAPAKPLWLLDEPFDALDADGIAVVDALLSAQAARGGSVLLTSHLPLGLRDPMPLEYVLDGVAR